MDTAERFLAYANAFEETYTDDDWSRLEPFFARDAVYEVKNAPFACRLEGRDAIFAGIRKSLDGFDRKFAKRTPNVEGEPEVTGDTFAISWKVTYETPGAPPLELRGRSSARFDPEGRILHLQDAYPEGANEPVEAWVATHGKDLALDPSYT